MYGRYDVLPVWGLPPAPGARVQNRLVVGFEVLLGRVGECCGAGPVLPVPGAGLVVGG